MQVSVILGDDVPSEQEWLAAVQSLDGGFFHTSAALPFAFPAGNALRVIVRSGTDTVGAALGVSRRCRMGLRPLHVRLAAAPLLARGSDSNRVMSIIAADLRREGAAELSVGSFGGSGIVAAPAGARPTGARIEYIVSLTDEPDVLSRRLSSTHRRHVRRGDKSGWALRVAEPSEAGDVLHRAQSSAAQRAAEKGGGFATGRLTREAVAALTPLAVPAGAAVMVAEAGSDLLAAALIGWANGRAFYLRGGATPLGYKENSGVWLHWSIMLKLRTEGMTLYNLGGTPGAAASAGHEQHGLHRFKLAFGADLVECRGIHWPLRRGHMHVHRAIEMVRGTHEAS